MPEAVSADRVSFRRQFPAIRLFDAAAIALSPVSVAIAAISAVLIDLSWWIVCKLITFTPSANTPHETLQRWLQTLKFFPTADFMQRELLLRPWTSVIDPASLILESSDSGNSHFAGLVQLILAIVIWSLAGTLLCRRAATLFVGDDESTVRSAIRYSFKRYPASATAPLIPLFTALIIGLLIAGIGLFGRLPFLGSVWLTIVSPVVMIFGFAIAFLLLITAIGWPLMVAAVATDDCDSFGGLSRAYSCLTGRPWHAFGFWLVSALIGIILMSVVNLFIETSFFCAISCTGSGSGQERAQTSLSPLLSSLFHLVKSGIGISFFWTAATIIYLLLRLEVDRVPLDRLALDDHARPARDPLPVVGIPATDAWKPSNGQASPPSD